MPARLLLRERNLSDRKGAVHSVVAAVLVPDVGPEQGQGTSTHQLSVPTDSLAAGGILVTANTHQKGSWERRWKQASTVRWV